MGGTSWNGWVGGIAALLAFGCGGSTTGPSAGPTVPMVDLGLEVRAGALGATCRTDDACDSGFCDRTIPDGACSQACDDAQPCEAGAVCFEGYCYAGCASPRQCRGAGFTCFELPGGDGGFCGPDVDAYLPAGPNVGAPCSALLQCEAPDSLEPYCVPEIGYRGERTGFPGGMCVALGCTNDVVCGAGARCIEAGVVGMCLPACAAASDCREGLACDRDRGVCSPDGR